MSVSFCPVSVPILTQKSATCLCKLLIFIAFRCFAERARFELAVRLPPLFFQCEKYNYLIVSILILHFIVNFYLFCPDFVPKQNNKNN